MTANAGTDVVLRSTSIGDDIDAPPGVIDESLVADARAWDGVAAAEPVVEGLGILMGSDGEIAGGGGAPWFAMNWVPNSDLNPYRLVEGRTPSADGEVVINRGVADAGKLAIGDRTIVRVPQAVEVTVVGIATFADLDSLAGITLTAFSLEDAQRHITQQAGKVSRIALQAAPGVSQDELVARIRGRLPAGVEAITGSELTEDNQAAIRVEFLDALASFLVVFAGVALLVATFSIVAVAHTVIVAVWRVLAHDCDYHDLGSDWYDAWDPTARTQSLIRQLEALGHHVLLQPAA